MSKKALVIGSNSFSGSHFVNNLLSKGFTVHGTSRSKEPHKVYLPYKYNKNIEKFNYFKCDLNKNLDNLINFIKKEKPQYIVNYSAQGMVAQSWDAPLDWFKTNVVSQIELQDQLRKFKFLKKYIHFSTPEVYGNTDRWIKENVFFAPNTPYATSRASCDLNLLSFFRNYDFPVTFTRAANVFGPGQQLYRIIPRAVMSCLLNIKMDLHGGGLSERSFIDVRDTAEATYKIMIDGKSGDTYHISTRKKISIKDIVLRVFNHMEKDFDKLVKTSEDRLGKDQAYLLNSNKIRKEINWSEIYKMDQTIKDTINWAEQNIEILKKMPLQYIHKK